MVDSDEDLEVSSSFNSSIALKGSFRSVRLLFFFLLTGSSEEEDERDSSESYPAVAGTFFFFFGLSSSDLESNSDSEKLKETTFPSFLLFLVDLAKA